MEKEILLVFNKHNVSEIIRRMNEIFTMKFAFNPKHSDVTEWYIERFDCGIDLKLGTDDEGILKCFIRALHDSFDKYNFRGVQYSEYKGWDVPEVRYESITLETAGYKNGNPLYRYNIYYKLLELVKYASEHGKILSQEEMEEIKDVVRIEKQIDDVAKIFGCSNKVGTLLNEEVTEKVMNNIVKEMKLFFGEGDYVSYEEGVRRIYDSQYTLEEKNAMSSVYAYVYDNGYSALLDYCKGEVLSHGGDDAAVKKKYKELSDIKAKIEGLGVSVAAVHNTTAMKGIGTLLDEELKRRAKPRKKHKFSEIMFVSESARYMCKPTLYKEDGTRGRTSIASSVGGTREECEEKVYEKIRWNLNRRYESLHGKVVEQIECCKAFYSDFSNFRTIVQSNAVLGTIDAMLEKITARIKKLEVRLHES